MKCPDCESEGKTSIVHSGGTVSTLMLNDMFWDEDGKRHNHDPNWHTASYRCSNGHEWHDRRQRECWCGWPDNKDKNK